ncbi:hypothetical protein FJT64_012533 [Amphibalanus amphitrite]|uniref:Uncharacterized protein n=1 Tax=Amphibalanus amphitrite TaxID=1232801 RepID=A0A6A4VCC1_AMPAM|nr:hypothetical protein FJT64_012533 [Amphibalanus amphitrite]
MGESGTLPESPLESRLSPDGHRGSLDGNEDGESTACWSDTSGSSDLSESERRADGRFSRQLERRRRKREQRDLWAASLDRTAQTAH